MKQPRNSRVLRKQAQSLLEDHGVEKPPIPVDNIAQSLGARLSYSPFDGDLAGMLIREGDDTVIGVNSLHHINRQRFTIAHECGHLVLHKGKDVYIDRSFRVNWRDQVSAQATDPEEIEANRFAAELLMPYQMLLDDLVEYDIDIEDERDLKELAQKYQVSVQALTHRISNLLKDIL